ncbi:CAPA peptides-like isoform X2 [Aethina tumida]|uniref:CAPA peptides-like isoform X2 n=1 Tax=Aethina tumida TaxID=116153 RepID=UPI0021490685|nr:CAPA peptides-like isoform X2 [Aethina tumida]
MRPFRLTAILLLGILVMAFVGGQEQSKRSSNMLPFPRIGRNDKGLWHNDYPNQGSYLNKFRREDRPVRGNRMAFPRIGRNDPWLPKEWSFIPVNAGAEFASSDRDDVMDRVEVYRRSENKPGLWFGPRMGKVHKRNSGDIGAFPWATIIIGDAHVPPKFFYNNPAAEPSTNDLDKPKDQN